MQNYTRESLRAKNRALAMRHLRINVSKTSEKKATESTAIIRAQSFPYSGGATQNPNSPPNATVTVHSKSVAKFTKHQSNSQKKQKLFMASTASTSTYDSNSSSGYRGNENAKISARQQPQQALQQRPRQLSFSNDNKSGVVFSKNRVQLPNHSEELGSRRLPKEIEQRKLYWRQKTTVLKAKQQRCYSPQGAKVYYQSMHGESGFRQDGYANSQQQLQQPPKSSFVLKGVDDPGDVKDYGGSAERNYGARSLINNMYYLTKISPKRLLLPTALTHFASSQYFNAPAAKILPKPPQHWLLESMAEAKAGSVMLKATVAADASVYYAHMIKHSKSNLSINTNTQNYGLLLMGQA